MGSHTIKTTLHVCRVAAVHLVSSNELQSHPKKRKNTDFLSGCQAIAHLYPSSPLLLCISPIFLLITTTNSKNVTKQPSITQLTHTTSVTMFVVLISGANKGESLFYTSTTSSTNLEIHSRTDYLTSKELAKVSSRSISCVPTPLSSAPSAISTPRTPKPSPLSP